MSSEFHTLLHQRAVELAKVEALDDLSEEKINLLVFSIGAENYGIELMYVSKTYGLKDLTNVPGMSSRILGIMNARGRVIPVFDLKTIFELTEKSKINFSNIITIEINDIFYGIATENLIGTYTTLKSKIQKNLSSVNEGNQKYIKGISKEDVIILDPLILSTFGQNEK